MEFEASQSYSVKTLSHKIKGSHKKLEFKDRGWKWGEEFVTKVTGIALQPPQHHKDMLLQAKRTGGRLWKTRMKGLGSRPHSDQPDFESPCLPPRQMGSCPA